MAQPPRTPAHVTKQTRGLLPTTPDHAAAHRRTGAFWLIAFAFLIAMAFSNVPTPLYPLYMRHDGFSILTVTAIFAFYVVGVVVSLLLAGPVLGRIGRNSILIPALILELVAATVILTGRGLAPLLAARLVTGLGVGMITVMVASRRHNRHATHGPAATLQRHETVSTVANIGGLGVGPLVTGILAQYLRAPLNTPYIVFSGLLVVSVFAVSMTAETPMEQLVKPTLRPQRIGVDHGDRAGHLAALAAGFDSFAVFGLFTSIAPILIAGPLHHPSYVLAGLTVFAVFCAAAAAQMLARRLTTAAKRTLGLLAQTLGMVILIVGMQASSLAAFIVGAIVAGAGAGILFKAAASAVTAIAPAAKRSEALAGFLLVVFLGLGLPAVGVGLATLAVTVTTAMTWCAGILAVVGVVALSRPHALKWVLRAVRS